MLKIVNPLISQINNKPGPAKFRFTAAFKDLDSQSNQNAQAIRLILKKIPGISDDLIDIRFDEPITLGGADHVASANGLETITCREPSDETSGKYPRGHVEIITKNPAELQSLLASALGTQLQGEEALALNSAFANTSKPAAARL